MRTALRLAVTGVLTAATVLTCGTAGATPPGPGVTARIISQTTVGDTDYTLREITVPPGQSTGWHYHDGPLYGFVKQGTLSHFDSTCASDGVYRKGSTIQEPSGPDHVHIGRNLGDIPLVLYVLYVLPHGSPFSEDAPNPGCPFQ
ncbi:cupin domain-containing protein [Streptomyces sp. NPDC048710]|uniref:cupin domain-containing protein n=1 Tax=unclassified Streptomyces TaxID=2593676 RepID=UPI0037134941